MRRGSWAGTGVMLVAAAGWLAGAACVPAAAAPSCTGATISQGQGLTLDVSSVLVTTGGCVQYANLTDVTVTVKISGSSFSERIPARTPASATAVFVANRSASVTATDGLRTGHGTISVEPPVPTPKASATYLPPPVESTASATPSHTPKPSPTPSATPTSASPTPARSASAISVLPGLPSLPSGSSGGPAAVSHPVVAPQVRGSGPSPVAATVVEPVGGSGRGLPAAVAGVIVIGLAAAFGRAVLAASPAVDRRGRHARLPL